MKTPTKEKAQKKGRMVVVPDRFAGEDRIGHQVHGEGLVEMIRSIVSPGSFTIGVYGQWGQGKTSMLRQIENALSRPGKQGESRILTIWFNPWQFSGEEHLIIPFFHTLIASLKREEKGKSGKEWQKKVSAFLKKLVRVPVALAYGLEGEVKIPLILKSKFCFDKTIGEWRRTNAEVDEAAAAAEKAAYEDALDEYESLYYNLLQDLQESVEHFDTKVVAFIDDLDRCLPEKAVQLLEGLKVLLDLPNFVFVIGVAREVIERGIRVRYKDLYLTNEEDLPFIEQEYLDKIIQFPISLPPPDPERFRSFIVDEQMQGLEEAQPFANTILDALGNNPRTLKRFINAISFSMWVADQKQDRDAKTFIPELLIKTSLIAFLFPPLYHQLVDYPHHLITLQKVLWELDEEQEKKPEEREGQMREAKKTSIPEIDRWLEKPNVNAVSAILRRKTRTIKNRKTTDSGFENAAEVKRYVYMLAPTLERESETKETSRKTGDFTVKEEMEGRMVRIEGGTFTMGDEEEGQYEATVDGFMMDRYPLTQSLYQKIMEKNPSHFEGKDRPVDGVSWLDAVEFCNGLSRRSGLDPAYGIKGEEVERIEGAKGFRLPTEAEWEYACRAGSKKERYGELEKIAWYEKNSGGSTHGVGQKDPNDWGLYDMLGNVWEWVWDWYGKYPHNPTKNYSGPDSGSGRVVRGGGWGIPARRCRSAVRGRVEPGAGATFWASASPGHYPRPFYPCTLGRDWGFAWNRA